jgi:hypothetical protein
MAEQHDAEERGGHERERARLSAAGVTAARQRAGVDTWAVLICPGNESLDNYSLGN